MARLHRNLLGLGLGLTLTVAGCHKDPEATAEPAPKHDEAAESEGEGAAHASASPGANAAGQPATPTRFGVPFAYEASSDEPLARARAFLGEVLRDNALYTGKGPAYFKAFADAQTPRATVLSCADSRVHNHAWDATPDNDNFTVRNIGNQFENSSGSIEYGIEHLRTPVLLIVGHTGCGAVKAAMENQSRLSPAIKSEVEKLKLGKPSGKSEKERWANAVVENVHAQVAHAVRHFHRELADQSLTVVGAVYDLRGELGKPGALHFVNVNSNKEPERLAAFLEAVGRGATAADPLNDVLQRVSAAARQLAEAPAPARRRAPHAARPPAPAAPPARNNETTAALAEPASGTPRANAPAPGAEAPKAAAR